MEELKNKISNYVNLSPGDLEYAIGFYKRKSLAKNEILIQPGQFVKHWYYVEKGCLCFYSIKDGNEKVLEFFSENDFFTDIYSYLKDKSRFRSSFYQKTHPINCMFYQNHHKPNHSSFSKPVWFLYYFSPNSLTPF